MWAPAVLCCAVLCCAVAAPRSPSHSSRVSLLQLPGPLSAVIKAQSQAAMTTVDFINAVGFEKENRSVINVDFKYVATDENGTDVPKTLTVPFLAMLPIPSLEVRGQ